MTSWVESFLATERGRFFIEVAPDYISDSFNVTNLRQKFPDTATYRRALEIVRGKAEATSDEIRAHAEHLYGLIHARFLLTNPGLRAMQRRYTGANSYEACPRTACRGTICLPYGEHEEPNHSRLRMFCPRCREVYFPRDRICSQIDGAYFGPSYILLFLQFYSDIGAPDPEPPLELRLFGFRVRTDETEYEEEQDESEYEEPDHSDRA